MAAKIVRDLPIHVHTIQMIVSSIWHQASLLCRGILDNELKPLSALSGLYSATAVLSGNSVEIEVGIMTAMARIFEFVFCEVRTQCKIIIISRFRIYVHPPTLSAI